MKPFFIALSLLLTLGTPALYAQDGAEESPAVPFHITSIDSGFGMEGDFVGEYRVLADSVRVRLTKAFVRISMNCPYKGLREFQAIRFVLAKEKPDGKHEMAFKSLKLHVGKVMSPGDEHTLDGVEFTIPKDAETDLSKHWLSIQMDDLVLNHPTKGGPSQGYAFADSCKDIFIRKAAQK